MPAISTIATLCSILVRICDGERQTKHEYVGLSHAKVRALFLAGHVRLSLQQTWCISLPNGCDKEQAYDAAVRIAISQFVVGMVYGGNSEPVVFSTSLSDNTLAQVSYSCLERICPAGNLWLRHPKSVGLASLVKDGSDKLVISGRFPVSKACCPARTDVVRYRCPQTAAAA